MSATESASENKALVLAAMRHLSDRNLPALFDMIHEEGSWSIPYRADRFQFAGFRDKAGIMELLTGFLGGFERFSFTVGNATAEGDRVAIEAHSEGVGPGSAQYRNTYMLIVFVRDGKLHTVREYFDPYQVEAYVEQWPAQS
jgi:uncharacterized protein